MDQKSPERANIANASGKEVDFMRSLLDKQHEFSGTSLEVNKIRQIFYLGRHTQQRFSCFQEAQEIRDVHSRLA